RGWGAAGPLKGGARRSTIVQAIENLTLLSGTVLARKPHPKLPDYDVVTLQVDGAEPVEGKANLLRERAGGARAGEGQPRPAGGRAEPSSSPCAAPCSAARRRMLGCAAEPSSRRT